MICQVCGVEAPTKYVAFHQNIGVLVMRFYKSVSGNLCKSCIHKNFWSLTGTTAVLGWWGTISLILTPCFILNNVGRYVLCLTMPPVPPGARRPQLTEEAVQRIQPFSNELFDRLARGEKLEDITFQIAQLAAVTPAQVMLYAYAVLRSQQEAAK